MYKITINKKYAEFLGQDAIVIATNTLEDPTIYKIGEPIIVSESELKLIKKVIAELEQKIKFRAIQRFKLFGVLALLSFAVSTISISYSLSPMSFIVFVMCIVMVTIMCWELLKGIL